MPISGYIAGGVQDALDDILQRRMQEQLRQQQEKQRQEQVQIEREKMAAMEAERAADRAFQKRQEGMQIGNAMAESVGAGEVTPQQRDMLNLSPIQAARIKEYDRPIIDARPLAGTAPLDASGPQSRRVIDLTPTKAQAQQQKLEDDRNVYLNRLAQARREGRPEEQLRAIGDEAFGAGVPLPASMMEPSESQKRQTDLSTRLAAEGRGEERWLRENAITNAQANARQAQADANIRNRPLRGGLADMNQAEASAVFKLQDDFQRDSKPFVLIRNAYQDVSAAASRKDAASNMALIFGVMKILDPTSVVREGEYATAQNAGSVPDQIRNSYNKAISGNFLTNDQVKNFVAMAKDKYTNAEKNQRGVMKTYTGRATNMRLDPKLIVEDLAAAAGDDDDTIEVFNPVTGKLEKRKK